MSPAIALLFSFFFFFLIIIFGRTTWLAGVPGPGIEPEPSAVKAQSLNHWIAREFPIALV